MLRLNDFECSQCGNVEEMLAHEWETMCCPMCNAAMEKLPPLIRVNMGVGAYGYYDENLGTYISTNRKRREECRRQGVTPKGDSPKLQGEAWV